MRMIRSRIGWSLAAIAVMGCNSDGGPAAPVSPEDVAVAPPPPALKRLSQAQYKNAIHDLIGAEIVIPPQLEPDVKAEGLVAIGMAQSSLSAFGIEKYEDAAFKIAQQALETPAYREALVPCDPVGPEDEMCFRQIAETLAPKAWRRPVDDGDLDALAAVGVSAATTLGSFDDGAEFVIAAILQNPNFLYRIEVGEPSDAGPSGYRYNNYEMATRLAFFLTNTTPDDELLAAAAAGELVTEAGVRAQARRLVQSDAAREAVANFFDELYELEALDDLSKDPTLFTHYNADLGPAMREETLRVIEHIVFEEDGDFRDLFTTRKTYVDRRLAALYEIPAPVTEGFGAVTLPETGGRRGLLGQASILAQFSHPGASSAVLRGRFVRVNLLCGEVPPPPANFNTGVPEVSEDARTLRERSQQHYQDPVCASCHERIDPIGFGLENFDAIGRWRELDNGGVIDPSGDLDGELFADAWELGEVVASHPQVGFCLTRNLYRYATNQVETVGELAQLDALSEAFAADGYRVQNLLVNIAASKGFRFVGEVVEDEGEDSE